MADELLTYGQQPRQTEEGILNSSVGLTVAGAGTVSALGFHKLNSGQRLWDKFNRGVAAAESISPGGILKTFRVSELLSTLETQVEEDLSKFLNTGKYGEMLKKSLPESALGKNIKFVPGRGVFGDIVDEAGEVLGTGVKIRAGSQQGNAIADFYARVLGVELGPQQSINDAILRQSWEETDLKVPFNIWKDSLPQAERYRNIVLATPVTDAGKRLAKAKVLSNLGRAHQAAQIGRLSVLLSKPLDIIGEIPGVGNIVNKLPGLGAMAAPPGTSSSMLGSFVKKAAVVGAAWKALEYADYLRSEDSLSALPLTTGVLAAAGGVGLARPGAPFSKTGLLGGALVGLGVSMLPRFDDGIFYGAASLFSDADTIRAHVSDITGYTQSIKQQNEITKGLISGSTALGFAGTGALAAGLGSYGIFLKDVGVSAWKERATEETLAHMAERKRYESGALIKEFWASEQGRKFADKPLIGKLSKIKSPLALGAIAGAAVWQGAATAFSLLSGNIRTAIPGLPLLMTDESAEEKHAIYSGEKEVAIRKGRYWEFGKCLLQHTEIITEFGISKEAKDIKIEDKLLSSDGSFCSILNIWERNHSGLSYYIYSALDKNTPTGVTENHKIPVLTKDEICCFKVIEKEARDIKVGEYTQVSIPNLIEDIIELPSEEFIKTGLFLLDSDNVYPAQTNWYSKKIQLSRGNSIPRKIILTPGLGRLFGYFLAEGNLSYKNDIPNMIETAHSKSERWIVDDIISICEKEFNITPTVRFKLTGKKTKEGAWIVRICSSLLARIYFELFYKSDRQQDKIFPQVFMSAPKNFKEEVVEGYWRGDGHLEQNSKVISSCRKELLEKTQCLLLNLGYYPTIDRFEKNDSRGRYKIRWNQNKQYTGRGYRNNFIWWNEKLFVKVQKILIEEYSGAVYDFEVDHPDHLFVAGTFLVHNSKYQGDETEYFRQHFIPRLRARAYQKGLWGDESEKWAHDPMLNPVKALFGSDEWKYYYERKYAYERGAPVSGTYFEDVPFIGPLLAATFGELLKPRKAIRPEEWNMGGGSYLYRPDFHGESEPAYEYGGTLPGSPVMPGETSQLLNELNYRRTEMIGLPGFMEETIRKAFTGRGEPFQNLQTFEAMGNETSTRTWFWEHLNVGGAALLSEPIRRFIPAERSYLQTYNPLRNNLPSWIPEDYFLDLKHGNPLQKIKEGEIRTPGSGFSALHPEVQGLSPEEYPMAYKVKVLGDIAAHSEEYKRALREAKTMLHSLPPNQAKMVLETERQVKAKKRRKEFDERVTLINQMQQERVTVTEIISPHLVKTKEYGTANIEVQGIGSVKNAEASMEYMRKALMGREITIHTPTDDVRKFDSVNTGPRVKALVMMNGSVDIAEALERRGLVDREDLDRDFAQVKFSPNQKLAGVLSDALLRGIETPMDYLTPFAPAQKFIHQRSAIEDYIATQAVGTKNAFWDRPIENFISPAKDMFLYKSGLKDGLPDRVQEKRKINEYFDMLKWVKYSQLEQKAKAFDDLETAGMAIREKKKTVFGADLFGLSGDVKKALPRAERDYFDAFSQAKNEQERQQILELVPDNLRRVYTSQWLSKAAAASYVKKEAGTANKQDLENINRVRQLRASQGFDYHEGQIDTWQRDTNGQIPFDDYIRELKAAEFFATHSLPDPSWVGWSASVDLEDIKLKYVEDAGLSYHDFDLWDQRKISLARKPYVSTAVQQLGMNAPYQSSYGAAEEFRRIAANYSTGKYKTNISQIDANLGGNRYNITVNDQRHGLVNSAYKSLGV